MESWIHVSPSSGTGSTSAIVTVDANTDSIERSTSITVTSNGGIKKVISINQKPKVDVLQFQLDFLGTGIYLPTDIGEVGRYNYTQGNIKISNAQYSNLPLNSFFHLLKTTPVMFSGGVTLNGNVSTPFTPILLGIGQTNFNDLMPLLITSGNKVYLGTISVIQTASPNINLNIQRII